uniref:Uncharacterized protein n=1 Tax=Utricularia reniformis TaxID=192314 RepID=A0A1Y0AZY4_9LAMI|nr:hypothetical protein AEK19_MT0489 [Utricularia reniformis]ART30746.1 hypothetical protein AEK19_MT0489 [Utricularia reniformis]
MLLKYPEDFPFIGIETYYLSCFCKPRLREFTAEMKDGCNSVQ